MYLHVLQLIEANKNEFSPAEQIVAKYIIEQPDKIIRLTTKQLAEASGASEASIIRFCKRIGINSFTDLKLAIAEKMSPEGQLLQDMSFFPHDTVGEVLEKVRDRSISAITNTYSIINELDLEKAVSVVDKARRVYVYGAGGSSVVAQDISYKLLRINIPTYISQDIHIQMMMVANIEPNDVLFVVSTSGKTKDIMNLITEAKSKGAITILLTQHRKSPAQKLADIILTISDEEKDIRIGTMSARIAQLVIIDAFFIALCMKKGNKVYERIIDTHEAVQSRMKSKKN